MHYAYEEDLPARDTRRLLRQLRDLNLSAILEVTEDRWVSVDGCLTLDSPPELGVSYSCLLYTSPSPRDRG